MIRYYCDGCNAALERPKRILLSIKNGEAEPYSKHLCTKCFGVLQDEFMKLTNDQKSGVSEDNTIDLSYDFVVKRGKFITDEAKEFIINKYEEGAEVKLIAEALGLSAATIYKIIQ